MNNFEESQRIKTAYSYISELLGVENFDYETKICLSDVYNMLQRAMKDVAIAQRYSDAVFASAIYYKELDTSSGTMAKSFRDTILNNPLVGNVDNDSKIF